MNRITLMVCVALFASTKFPAAAQEWRRQDRDGVTTSAVLRMTLGPVRDDRQRFSFGLSVQNGSSCGKRVMPSLECDEPPVRGVELRATRDGLGLWLTGARSSQVISFAAPGLAADAATQGGGGGLSAWAWAGIGGLGALLLLATAQTEEQGCDPGYYMVQSVCLPNGGIQF